MTKCAYNSGLTNMQVFVTKNPKCSGSLQDFPVVRVETPLGETLGILYTVVEKTHNRFGGTNRWEVTYWLEASNQSHLRWVNPDDKLYRPWCDGQTATQKYRLLSPTWGGSNEERVMIDLDTMKVIQFNLRVMNPITLKHMDWIPKDGLFHFWDGKCRHIEWDGESWKEFSPTPEPTEEVVTEYSESDTESDSEEIKRPRHPRRTSTKD